MARQLVDAIDGAALVAAGDDQLVADGLDDVFLGLAFQVTQHTLLHPQVDLLVDTDGADEDFRSKERRSKERRRVDSGGGAGDFFVYPFSSLFFIWFISRCDYV